MFVGKENSRNNLEQKRGKSLKLVSLTSFCQCTWQVVTLTMLNLLIEWSSVWQTKTCLIKQPIDEFTQINFFSVTPIYQAGKTQVKWLINWMPQYIGDILVFPMVIVHHRPVSNNPMLQIPFMTSIYAHFMTKCYSKSPLGLSENHQI